MLMEEAEMMSSMTYDTLVLPLRAEMASAVVIKGSSRRPTRPIEEAPARANDFAIAALVPVPPPVIKMVLSWAEREARVGSMCG